MMTEIEMSETENIRFVYGVRLPAERNAKPRLIATADGAVELAAALAHSRTGYRGVIVRENALPYGATDRR